MHLIMIVSALILTSGWRLVPRLAPMDTSNTGKTNSNTWSERWQSALSQLLFPPLLLGTTTLAILCMGPHGEMVWGWEGWLSYGLAWGFASAAISRLGLLCWQGWQTLQVISTYPLTEYHGQRLHLLPLSQPYSAQVGFWQPQLVLSEGLLSQFAPEHLAAVLWHEQAHVHYRDTFWFFWLGWAKQLTGWLPNSENLWQDLLLLREIRADQWAGQYTDKLLLAEALLQMVATAQPSAVSPNASPNNVNPNITAAFNAGFNAVLPANRLLQRIDALCTEAEPNTLSAQQPWQQLWQWVWLICVCWPLIVIPLHHSY